MITVVATGVFNILHPGHLLYLEESKKLGDKLIVIVARDSMARGRKEGNIIPEEQRLEIVKALTVVDEAILGNEEDIFFPIERINPDIITLGMDQHFSEEDLERELQGRNLKAKVVRIEAYWNSPLNSSGKIAERLRNVSKVKKGKSRGD